MVRRTDPAAEVEGVRHTDLVGVEALHTGLVGVGVLHIDFGAEVVAVFGP